MAYALIESWQHFFAFPFPSGSMSLPLLLRLHGVSRAPPALLPLLCPSRPASRLVIASHGAPAEAIKLEEFDPPSARLIRGKDVLVRMLMAPVNPADVNVIQGTYAITPPSLPAVAGGDGVGQVDAVGEDVRGMGKGDWVVPSHNMDGTWTTHFVTQEDRLIKVGFLLCCNFTEQKKKRPGTS